jgi:hypothetical protein
MIQPLAASHAVVASAIGHRIRRHRGQVHVAAAVGGEQVAARCGAWALRPGCSDLVQPSQDGGDSGPVCGSWRLAV